MTTDLLSPADQQFLQMSRQEASPLPPAAIIPQIKLASFGSAIEYKGPTDGLPEGSVTLDGTLTYIAQGSYYISRREKNDDGNYEEVITPIGPAPEIIILRRLYSYSWYSEKQNKLMAWTNELSSFGSEQDVLLINNRGERPVLEQRLPYPDFKRYIQNPGNNYIDPEGTKLLKFRNVLYVLHEGKPYRMFVSNASVTGIPEGEKTGDYKKPEPASLLAFQNGLSGPEPESQAFFERKCRLGSTLVRSSLTYYIMTFEDQGPVDDLSSVIQDCKKLLHDLKLRFANDFGPFLRVSTPPADDGLPEFEVMPHVPSIDPNDLPF